jgi:hypothetical protein
MHKISLEAMSVGSGEMEKFGGIWLVGGQVMDEMCKLCV